MTPGSLPLLAAKGICLKAAVLYEQKTPLSFLPRSSGRGILDSGGEQEAYRCLRTNCQ